MGTWSEITEAFEQAATWFTLSAPAARGRWSEPALGEWTVRDLVGHTSRALLTVESYLSKPADAAHVVCAADYFRLALASIGSPAEVAQRGREAGIALGDDPAEAVAAIAERVTAQVRAAAGHDLVSTPVGGMRLIDYLPTRTFELTVHTCDLAVALGQAVEVPSVAARASVSLLGDLAIRMDQAGPLLLAATGRQSLPDEFTLLA